MKNIHPLKNHFRSLIIICLLQTLAFTVKAADYYWVNGSGNWSDYAGHWATTSGGTIFHTAIPTLNDDVYFDANSFNANGQVVLIDNTLIYCRSMNFTGVQFNPSVNGLGNTLHVYGSLTLVPAMNWSVKRVDFKSNLAGNLVTQAGHPMDTLYFDGAGTYGLTENILAKSIYIYDGSFASNNFNITTQKFIAGQTGATVNVDLGTSVVNISNEFRAYDGTINMNSSATDLNFANSVVAKMYLWSSGHTFNNIFSQSNTEVIGNFNCQQLTANGTFYINTNWLTSTCTAASFSGNTTLDCIFIASDVSLNTPGTFLKMRQLTINNSFIANGLCGSPIQISPIDFLPTGTLTKNSGVVNVDYTIITSINATGGATFNASNSVDGGNNTGWNISSPAARTLYWVGGDGTWTDIAHWATSSGGAGGNCIPASYDNVIFDANSFIQPGDTVLINSSLANCNNMVWSGVNFTPVFKSTSIYAVNIYGSLTLDPNMIASVYTFQFRGSSVGNTIFTAGHTLNSVTIDGTGTWSLTDELNCSAMQIYRGTFSSNSHDITATYFSANGINNNIFVDFGSSNLYIGENYVAFSNALTINSSSANLIFNNGSGATIYAQLADASFNNVTCLKYTYFSGKLTCSNFNAQAAVYINHLAASNSQFALSSSGGIFECDTISFGSGVLNFAFDSLVVNDMFTSLATCASPLTLRRYSPFAANCYFVKTSGTITLEYTYLQNIAASGGATFIANNSWDLGGNSGWTINASAPRNLYWVGGTGSWQDAAHWSTTSGGAGGNCQPGPQDNAYFDSNSFGAGDTVYVNPALGVYVNTLYFAGIPNPTVLYSTSNSSYIHVNGSLELVPELNLWGVSIDMTSDLPGNTVASGANSISEISFTGAGDWTLQENLSVINFSAGDGTFITNGYNLNAAGMNLGGNATLDLGTSTVTTSGIWSNFNTTILGDSADLVINSSTLNVELMNAHFNSIRFLGDAHTQFNFSCNYLYAMANFTDVDSEINAGYAEFKSNVTLIKNLTCDSLILDNPGKMVRISNVTVNDYMVSNGNSGFPVQIEGLNGAGTIQKASGQVCLDYVLIKDINATGGAQFFAGSNGVDLGGNSGWVFGPCTPLVTDVWPGDANYDLTADNFDILNIGLAYGYTGTVRSAASLNWVAQPSQDWFFQFADGTNLKHADTDGSGLVDLDDTLAVSLNYGLTHPFREMNPAPGNLPSPLLYVVANPDTVSLSDTVNIEVFLGNSTQPVDSIYGIAFTLNLDTAMVNTSFLSVDFAGCWMGIPQTDLITFHKNLLTDGKVDFTIVRNDQQNVNGFGFLTRMGIVIVDNVGAKVTMPVWLSDIKAITASEFLLTIGTENDSIVIDTAATVGISEPVFQEFNVSVYPNPVKDKLQVNAGSAKLISCEIYNASGRLVENRTTINSEFTVNTTSFVQGVYFLRLVSESGVVVKRFEVVRK